MIKKWFMLILTFCCISGKVTAQNDTVLKLWYDSPARQWVEALPLGNGSLGAMVFGDPIHERFQLNEETVWGGSPHNNTNPKAKEALPRIRQLIFDDYYRDLDIEKAIATTRFTANGVTYVRETFTSFPDRLLVIRLTASKKRSISFTAHYTTPYTKNTERCISSRNELQLNGKANDHEGIEGKVRFTALTQIENNGGTLKATSDSTLQVKNANSVVLYVSIGTNFINYKDVSGDALKTARQYMKQAGKNYAKRKEAHIAAYQKYFNRVSLDLGSNSQIKKPTDRRVKEFSSTADPQWLPYTSNSDVIS